MMRYFILYCILNLSYMGSYFLNKSIKYFVTNQSEAGSPKTEEGTYRFLPVREFQEFKIFIIISLNGTMELDSL
jgi:hypothetical protein